MNRDRGAADPRQLLDGGEILSCTFATMDMLQRAVAAELGEDDGGAYGLTPRRDLQLLATDDEAGEPPADS